MNADENKVIYRKDYSEPSFWIDRVELEFDLEPNDTLVTARIELRRNVKARSKSLRLDGEQLLLKSIDIDGKPLSDDQYRVDSSSLVIDKLPDRCVLATQVVVDPESNHALSGLYQSSGNFCTQCEAMGFRRITYFLDRPDVMATYRVTLRADQSRYPVLLSNGNRVEESLLDDGRHQVTWEDPHPKPSYLFALVGGNLKCHRGIFVTKSGRNVTLEIWVEPQNIDRCEHALVSLQKSMRWDEERYGLEYDLDIYMIVAVNDFNMGAMENKGLNIFNTKFVLASPETATDDDYLRVEAVIAHEYFHNWTGNRVTCRDWFQLTLKEGLTVFRDQQFTADQTSEAVKRIDDVALLRSRQFAEDSGPMAHPIRPESYVSMDNFYTATVYNKGAEIIRMYHTRLGEEGFRRGMDLYFKRHDGSAATCDDFRSAMNDAGNQNFDLMERWYAQAGTPELTVNGSWDAGTKTYRLSMTQSYPDLAGDIPGSKNRKPVPIPVLVGLIGEDGSDIDLDPDGEHVTTTRTLLFDQASQSFTFDNVSAPVVPSVLRKFSAPVQMRHELDDDQLAFLMANDSDEFNRWDAAQKLATRVMVQSCFGGEQNDTSSSGTKFIEAVASVLSDMRIDDAFKAVMLTLPSETIVGQSMETVEPDAIHQARKSLSFEVATAYRKEMIQAYHSLAEIGPYSMSQESVRKRRLKNVVLDYLAVLETDETAALVFDQYNLADNMTDKESALVLLANSTSPQRKDALDDFYRTWKSEPLVLDKWFSVQASSSHDDTVEHVHQLSGHSDFSLLNPNRVRSLVGVFAANQLRFHQPDGAGYRFLADHVIKIDASNPQLAARLVAALNSYRRFDQDRQILIRQQLSKIEQTRGISKDVGEIVERAINF